MQYVIDAIARIQSEFQTHTDPYDGDFTAFDNAITATQYPCGLICITFDFAGDTSYLQHNPAYVAQSCALIVPAMQRLNYTLAPCDTFETHNALHNPMQTTLFFTPEPNPCLLPL